MLYIGGKKLRNRVKLSTKVKTCVPNLAVVRRFDCSLEPNTKSTGMDTPLLNISPLYFLGMSRASDNTKAAMKKQMRRTHTVFSHVRPWPFSFLHLSSKFLKRPFRRLYWSRHFLKRWLGNKWKARHCLLLF